MIYFLVVERTARVVWMDCVCAIGCRARFNGERKTKTAVSHEQEIGLRNKLIAAWLSMAECGSDSGKGERGKRWWVARECERFEKMQI